MLTGKDVFGLYKQACTQLDITLPCQEFECMSNGHQALYEQLAANLNETHITPLQGVVREYRTLVERMNKQLHEHAADSETLDRQRYAINHHAESLLGEESHP